MNLGGLYFLCTVFYFNRPHLFIYVNQYKWRILSISRVPNDSYTFRRKYQRLVVFAISGGRQDIWSYCFHIGKYFLLFVAEGGTSICKAWHLWTQRWDHCYKLIFKLLFCFCILIKENTMIPYINVNFQLSDIVISNFKEFNSKNLQHEVDCMVESEISLNLHIFVSVFGQEIKEKVENIEPWWFSCKKYMRSS